MRAVDGDRRDMVRRRAEGDFLEIHSRFPGYVDVSFGS
jgi:hypothetical protein